MRQARQNLNRREFLRLFGVGAFGAALLSRPMAAFAATDAPSLLTDNLGLDDHEVFKMDRPPTDTSFLWLNTGADWTGSGSAYCNSNNHKGASNGVGGTRDDADYNYRKVRTGEVAYYNAAAKRWEPIRAYEGETARVEDLLHREVDQRVSDVNAEELRASSAESGLGGRITSEVNRATSAESTLRIDLNSEVSNRQAAVSDEEKRAKKAEEDLAAGVDAKISAAVADGGAVNTYVQNSFPTYIKNNFKRVKTSKSITLKKNDDSPSLYYSGVSYRCPENGLYFIRGYMGTSVCKGVGLSTGSGNNENLFAYQAYPYQLDIDQSRECAGAQAYATRYFSAGTTIYLFVLNGSNTAYTRSAGIDGYYIPASD